jgi:hypothetical protein
MREKATPTLPLTGEAVSDTAESKTLCMRRHSKRENREILLVSIATQWNGQKTSTTVMLA